MAAAKTERLLNLTICLLSMKRYVTRDEIRHYVQGYADSTDLAFERMFERDKEELRRLGVPIETGTNDRYFDDEQGYRIRPDDFELPAIELTAEEAAVVGVAARAWRQTTMAGATVSALAKLRGAGIEPDIDRLPMLEPVVTASEPGFEIWYEAVLERVRVRFDYADRGTRTVEPWRLTSQRGRWYVIGHDTDRDATRVFRLSRVRGVPALVGRPGVFTPPADVDLDQLMRSLEPPPTTAEMTVAVRRDKAPALRRRGTRAVPVPDDLPPGYETYRVGYTSLGVAGELAGYGSDVVVLDPPELRDALIAHLTAIPSGEGAA